MSKNSVSLLEMIIEAQMIFLKSAPFLIPNMPVEDLEFHLVAFLLLAIKMFFPASKAIIDIFPRI